MRILIISDIHGNKEAVESITEKVDYVFFLGDIIDYGPDPKFSVDYVKKYSDYTVKGNHDNAISYDMNCRSQQEFRKISHDTRQIAKKELLPADIEYLRYLPVTEYIKLPYDDFFMVHATPSNPLYHYIDKNSTMELQEEVSYINSKYILLGHSHLQWTKQIGSQIIISPGSVGLSKDHPQKACYAIWENGNVELKHVEYDIDTTIKKIENLKLEKDSIRMLINAFTTGRVN